MKNWRLNLKSLNKAKSAIIIGVIICLVSLISGLFILIRNFANLESEAYFSYYVNSTDDLPDTNITDFNCISANGKCTLRAAIQNANYYSGIDFISLLPGVYTLTIPGTNEDLAATGDLDVYGDVHIFGSDPKNTIIQAGTNSSNGIDRIFDFMRGTTGQSGQSLNAISNQKLENVTLRYGKVDNGSQILNEFRYSGGAVRIYAPNTGSAAGLGGAQPIIRNVIMDRNSATRGGGIALIGSPNSMTLDNVQITNNNAVLEGGGVYIYCNVNDKNAEISQTLIASNTASEGGGIYNATRFTGKNVTITNNVATNSAGGISSGTGCLSHPGSVNISNYTIANNTSPAEGGLKFRNFNSGNSSTINNSIIANNGSPNCTTTAQTTWSFSGSNNIINDNSCSSIVLPSGSNLHNTNPLLSNLSNNGGFTQTMAINSLSPAIDAGSNCSNLDQRKFTRPVDGNSDSLAVCDIGAFEFQNNHDLDIRLYKDDFIISGQNNTYTLKVKNNVGFNNFSGSFNVEINLPPKATYISNSGNNWSCTQNNMTLNCTYNLPILTGATSNNLSITITADDKYPNLDFVSTARILNSDGDNSNNYSVAFNKFLLQNPCVKLSGQESYPFNIMQNFTNFSDVVDISAVGRSVFLLKSDGSIWAGIYGRTSEGLTNPNTFSKIVPEGSGVKSIGSGTLAVLNDGRLVSFRTSFNPQTGYTYSDTFVYADVDAVQISDGWGSILKEDGTVNYVSQGRTGKVVGLNNVKVVADNVFLKTDGTVWGVENYISYTNNTITDTASAFEFTTFNGMVDLKSGYNTGGGISAYNAIYALKADSTVWRLSESYTNNSRDRTVTQIPGAIGNSVHSAYMYTNINNSFHLIDSIDTVVSSVFAVKESSSGSDDALTTLTVVEACSSDLEINKSSMGEFKPGNTVNYTLNVSNLGPYRSSPPIVVTDNLPAELTFVSATGTNWNCTVSGQTITCTYNQTMNYLQSGQINVQARVKQKI